MKFPHTIFVVLLVLCQLIGLVTYLQGFFPLKKAVDGKANLENLPSEPDVDGKGTSLSRKFDRLVIVLIDALRADFMFSDNLRMPYTQKLIKNNETISILAKAHPPTVTMPRIKALTSGGVPGFVDVVLNANSKAFLEDNLITQMKHSHKKLVFYGDDTWIKLFPDHFSRMDGTTSFFVTDYTEVDNNVTRHIASELQNEDWDVLILHYLGLDHIGHIAGPSSPLVTPKLQEMDQIIEQIHRNILRWDKEREAPSLLVLCGDHGMSDGGSHGGASAAEVSTPLVLMSSLFQEKGGTAISTRQVQQIDTVPTLALLLGLPIPQNSIGTVILDAFKHHPPRDRIRALQLNAHQVSKVLEANGHSSDDIWELHQAYKLHSDWLKAAQDGQKTTKSLEVWAEQVAKQYTVALQKMSSRVVASLSSYDLHALTVGILVLMQTFVWVVCGLVWLKARVSTTGTVWSATGCFVTAGAVLVVVVIHLSVCSGTDTGGSEILCSTSVQAIVFSTTFSLLTASTLAAVVLSMFQEQSLLRVTLLRGFTALQSSSQGITGTLLCAGTAVHAASLLSSSFVEEEHQTWYFLTTAYFLVTAFDAIRHKPCEKSNKTRSGRSSKDSWNMDLKDKSTKQRNVLGRDRSKEHAFCHDNSKLGVAFDKPESGVTEEQNQYAGQLEFREVLPAFAVTVVLLLLGRLSRAWNQTGIKWADQPDIGDWLVKPEQKTTLSVLAVTSTLIIWIFRYQRHNLFTSAMLFIGSIGVYFYRSATGNLWLPWKSDMPITKGIDEARFVYFCVFASMAGNMVCFSKACMARDNPQLADKKYLCKIVENFLTSLLLLETLLLRPHNITLLAIFVIQEHLISRYVWSRHSKDPWVVVLGGLWMGHAAYFAQGNSNSLATVDLAAGYIGLKDHVSSIVLPLLCMATYCGPILWFTSVVLFFVRYSTSADRLYQSLHQMCYVRLLCQTLLLSVYTVLVFVQRYHLFVWSVFSPKLLYELMATFVLSFCVMYTLGLSQLIGQQAWSVEEKQQ